MSQESLWAGRNEDRHRTSPLVEDCRARQVSLRFNKTGGPSLGIKGTRGCGGHPSCPRMEPDTEQEGNVGRPTSTSLRVMGGWFSVSLGL